jgi:hypothetical protein
MIVVPNALPDRPLRVEPLSTGTGGGAIGTLVLLGLLVGMWLLGYPSLARDMRSPSDLTSADIPVGEAKCTTYTFIVTSCDVGSRDRTQRFSYFLFNTSKPQTVEFLRSRTDSTYLTTNLGQATLGSRIALIVATTVLLATGLFAIMFQLIKASAATKDFNALDNQKLALVVMPITKFYQHRKRQNWTYAWNEGGVRKTFTQGLNADTPPLLLANDAAVAVRGPNGGTPMLLARDLSNVRLTAAEKTQVIAALQQINGGKQV